MHTKNTWQASEPSKGGNISSRLRWLLSTFPLDWSASFFYLSVLVFGLLWLVRRMAWWFLPIFIVVILTLFLLDYIEYLRYRDKAPKRVAAWLLLLRFVCISLAILLTPSFTTMLYLALPFRTMLYFGRKVAYAMAVLIMIINTALFWFDPRQGPGVVDIRFAYIFCIGCIWSVLKAQFILRERENQQREYQSRIRAEELLEEVRRSHRQLSIYAQQVATLVTIEERNRVARDLHDSLGHSLTAIHLQLEKALVYYTLHPQEALQSVQDARDVARVALKDVRRSVSTLRAVEQPFSCTQETAQLGEQLRKNGLSVHFEVTGSEEAFSRQALMTLYRVAQEGCTNIQRHARAGHVQIALDFGLQEARLSLCDDGVGFDFCSWLEQEEGQEQSYGLRGMQERLQQVNGVLQLESIPGQGTQLIAIVSILVQGDLDARMSLMETEREREDDGT